MGKKAEHKSQYAHTPHVTIQGKKTEQNQWKFKHSRLSANFKEKKPSLHVHVHGRCSTNSATKAAVGIANKGNDRINGLTLTRYEGLSRGN